MDTCLTNIEDIYITVGDKKRRLVSGNIVPSKVKGIFIICKVIIHAYTISNININAIHYQKCTMHYGF